MFPSLFNESLLFSYLNNYKCLFDFYNQVFSFLSRSRNTTAVENPVYAAVDEKESSSQPKASTLPLPTKNQNGSIKGPLDPTVHYATSQKKKITKQPRQGPLESANAGMDATARTHI